MKKTIHFLYLFLAGAFILISCNRDDDTCTEKVGPISCEDFRSVTPPTYEQVIKCYDDAIAANAQQSDSSLARSIFACIKVAPVQNPPDKPLFDLQSRMCLDEWKLVILYPRKAYAVFKDAINKSLERAKQEFPEDADVQFKDAKADAFRHAYLGVLTAKATDTVFARQMAEARLSCRNQVDFHNDTVGVGLVRRFRTALETELATLLLERRYYFSENNVPTDAGSALVFNAARRAYDVAYTGTFTNPDGQGTWNAVYYFHQTGNLIRGEARYTGINFPDKASRRYKGILSGNTINLDVSNPYTFEFSPGYTPCRDMKTTLTISQDAMQGSWTASNCSQGGVISLKK